MSFEKFADARRCRAVFWGTPHWDMRVSSEGGLPRTPLIGILLLAHGCVYMLLCVEELRGVTPRALFHSTGSGGTDACL